MSKHEIAARLRIAREKKGLRQDEAADALGVKPQTISNYERAVSRIDTDSLMELCQLYGVSVIWMLQGDDADEDPTPTPWHKPLDDAYERAEVPVRESACRVLDIDYIDPGKPSNVVPFKRKGSKEMTEVPYCPIGALAGSPSDFDTPPDFETIEVPKDDVPYNADFAVAIDGRSMEPSIANDSIVWVHEQKNIDDNQIGIFMVGGSAVCKRAIMDHFGYLERLQSDNDNYPDIEVDELGEDEEIRIVGRVVGTYLG